MLISLYLYWMKKRKKTKKEYVIFSLRGAVYLLLILALTIPSLLYPVKGLHTVFLVDQSDSVKRVETEILATINESIKTKQEEDQYSIVTFANKPKLDKSFTSESDTVSNLSINTESQFTNIEEAIRFATNTIPENKKGRIVLISDGVETNGKGERLSRLGNKENIELDAISFQPPNVEDVSIQSFVSPQTSFEGEAIPLQIVLDSNVDTTATLVVTKNEETIVKEEVDIAKGTNQFSYQFKVSEPGMSTFKAEIYPKSDQIVENNVSHALTQVSGQPKILMVDQEGEGENVFQALTASGWKVDRMLPELLPTTLSGFLDYDSIILHNISGHHLSETQMELMESAVRDFGTGFIMTGGNESYGLGGYFKTPIEKLLPVDMDVKGKKEIPSLGLIIVLDRSGSMMGEKFELAKEAAARSVELLKDDDTFGFIAFDTESWQVVETKPISDKEEVINSIRSTALGGGTNIFPALSEAYGQLSEMNLKRKHIILLTDGQSENGPYEEIIEEGLSKNVTLSTVAIGGDADINLLEELAGLGTGRFYEVYDASAVPSILSRETALTTKTYIEDNPHVPSVYDGYDWSSRFKSGTPSINAYVATTLKPRADLIVESEKKDPILSRMSYGLGRSIAWTTDVSGAWSGDFPSWEQWSGFWNDLLTWSLPSYQTGSYFVSSMVEGGKVSLKIDATDNNLLPLAISVTDNKGQKIENVTSKMVGPGQYELEFSALPDIYFLNVMQEEEGEVISTFKSGIVVPFSTEYEQRPVNMELLETLTGNMNGKILEEPKDAFRPWHKNLYRSQSVWVPFVVLAFLLFIVEIFIRRFGLVRIPIKKKPKKKIQRQQLPQKVEIKRQTSSKQSLARKEVAISKPSPGKEENKKKEKAPPPQSNARTSEERMNQLLQAKNRKRNKP